MHTNKKDTAKIAVQAAIEIINADTVSDNPIFRLKLMVVSRLLVEVIHDDDFEITDEVWLTLKPSKSRGVVLLAALTSFNDFISAQTSQYEQN